MKTLNVYFGHIILYRSKTFSFIIIARFSYNDENQNLVLHAFHFNDAPAKQIYVMQYAV